MPNPADTPFVTLPVPHDERRAAAARDWERLVDSGAILSRNPPAPDDAVAARAANDALFRAIQRRQWER